jgi:nucleoside-diphosphate-sugar epimerase
MNILIIGGSNFIGWRFVELLGQTNHNVTVLNRGNHPRNYPANVTHIICDRYDLTKFLTVVKSNKFDLVYDMCAFVSDDMQSTVNSFSIKPDKYVFISTAATYIEPEELPISENHPQGIHGIWGKYGGGKFDCEKILLDAYAKTGFPAVIVRPSYVYGIGNTIDRETFLFDRITKGRKILIPRYGEAVIQLGEVTDLCRALLAIGEKPGGLGTCYNISGNEFITLNGLIRLVADIIGKSYQTIFVNPKDYGMTDRDIFPFDNSTYFTTCEKFSIEFQWEPMIMLRKGLTQTYENWLSSSNKLPTKYDKENIVLEHIMEQR